MFSKFFIDRPIFATVLSVVITLAGAIAVIFLPVTQYPEITPPTVEVSTTYPGANANVVADTVAAPIEQQVNGVESMMYLSSQCTNDGNYVLTVTFEPGTDLNLAQIMVQNRVSLAEPILPDLVKHRGVTVKKKSPSVLMIVNLFSPDASRDNLYLSNYATIQLRDELSGFLASAPSPFSASAITACGSGSIRSKWQCAASARPTSSAPSSSKIPKSRPARSVSLRPPPGRSFNTQCRRSADWPTRRNSAT